MCALGMGKMVRLVRFGSGDDGVSVIGVSVKGGAGELEVVAHGLAWCTSIKRRERCWTDAFGVHSGKCRLGSE